MRKILNLIAAVAFSCMTLAASEIASDMNAFSLLGEIPEWAEDINSTRFIEGTDYYFSVVCRHDNELNDIGKSRKVLKTEETYSPQLPIYETRFGKEACVRTAFVFCTDGKKVKDMGTLTVFKSGNLARQLDAVSVAEPYGDYCVRLNCSGLITSAHERKIEEYQVFNVCHIYKVL